MLMATVFLHGHLGQKYGRRFEFAASSASEAMRLLAANFKTFTADMLAHRHGYVIRVDGKPASDIAKLQAHHLSPEIHIVPAIAGAGGGKNSGGALVVIAAAIAVAAYTGYVPTEFVPMAYNLALNLAISGVSQMLMAGATQADPGNSDSLTGETNKASYAFNGPVNTTAQGNPVPVLYGRLMVGSQVISAGIEVQ